MLLTYWAPTLEKVVQFEQKHLRAWYQSQMRQGKEKPQKMEKAKAASSVVELSQMRWQQQGR
jgi:hypothetical protein